MIIYDKTGKQILDIQVDDSSYRYRAIKQGDKVYLYFSLTEHVEIPLHSYIDYQGQRYILAKPENLTKHYSRNIEYSVEFWGWWELLYRTKYKLLSEKPHKLKFSLTATPKTFMQLLIDNLNLHDSGWKLGTCIEATEKLLSFSHEDCMSVLNCFCDEFNTEFEFEGKTVHFCKVEKFKDSPISLSYGKGKGFKSGVGRTNQGDKSPVTLLYVQGGERNIDRAKYNSPTLLLPKNQELEYQGRRYKTDPDGMYITRADKDLVTFNEDSYDASNIYPSRVGEVTGVETEASTDSDGKPVTFYNIIDTTIPDALNFRDCRLDGNTATIIFQSGKLAGREFDIMQSKDDLTGYDHATRTFKLVSMQEDGMNLPNEHLCPVVGDKYAVFNISLPEAYVCDNTTKTGASWDMFREAAQYMYENEDNPFTFKGDLDSIHVKRHWLEIGGKLLPGGYVLFSDEQFQKEGINIRITGVKDYINKPYSPELELSNTPVSGLVSSDLGKIDANEVTDADKHKQSIQYTKRRFRDAQETMTMLADALLTNFSESINPIAVATMQMLVGDESLQFRFVNSKTNPTVVNLNVTYNKDSKILSVPAGILQHMTLGIKEISSTHKYKFWDMGSYASPYLEPDKKYYLYAKCSKDNETGTFRVSDKAIALEQEASYYHFLVGVLNSEYDGERSYVSLYGFTEILPGRITTDQIVSTDGKTYFDLVKGIISGRIKFISSDGSEKNIGDLAGNNKVSFSDLDGTIIDGDKIKTNLIEAADIVTTELIADKIDVNRLEVVKLKGATGSFKRLDCVNNEGKVVGGISFYSEGTIELSGDIRHQGSINGRSFTFRGGNMWVRSSFGSRQRTTLAVYGTYAYAYYDGLNNNSSNRVYIPLSRGTTTSGDSYCIIPTYITTDGEANGMPVDLVIFYTSGPNNYVLDGLPSKEVILYNGYDTNSDIYVYSNGYQHQISGGVVTGFVYVGNFMYPPMSDDIAGRGWMVMYEYDNTWG